MAGAFSLLKANRQQDTADGAHRGEGEEKPYAHAPAPEPLIAVGKCLNPLFDVFVPVARFRSNLQGSMRLPRCTARRRCS